MTKIPGEKRLYDQYMKIVKKYGLRVPSSNMPDKNRNILMRLNVYIEKHPETTIAEACDIVQGISDITATKWCQRQYLIKTAHGVTTSAGMIRQGKSKQKEIKSPIVENIIEKRREAKRLRDQQMALGTLPIEVDDIDKEHSVQEIRKKIKECIWKKMADPEAVAKYANALARLSGVQDDELKDDFAEKQQITIYCPEEKKSSKVLEIEPIEHD